MDVRATGLKWFNSDGDDILGTGTTIDDQVAANQAIYLVRFHWVVGSLYLS